MNELPIDIVPGTCPTRFRWKQVVDVPVDAGTSEDRRCVEVEQPIPVGLEKPIAELIKLCKRLQAFKEWVHAYLDSRDVPDNPPGEHGAAGCRIGDRMDWVWAQITKLKAEVAELKRWQDKSELVEDTSNAATREQTKNRKGK